MRHGSFHVDMDRLISGLKARMGGATAASAAWTAKLEKASRFKFVIELRKSNEVHIVRLALGDGFRLDGIKVSETQWDDHYIFKINNDRFDLHAQSGLFGWKGVKLRANGTVILEWNRGTALNHLVRPAVPQ